jgi:nitrite reductase/ring-hydroxylating ferredoxin subunit
MNASQENVQLPLPNGWFAVSWSHELHEGEVKPVRCFGRDLVLYRTRDGAPALLDAYCPHLGAHLGIGGRVIGDNVRCPFHGWQFDATGQCVAIPHCKTIPPNAKLRGWDVVERNGLIFAWYDAQEKPPDWEVPTIAELGDADWTEPRRIDLEVPIHLQELAENNCDPAHFEFVHGTDGLPPSEMELAEDGRFFRMSSPFIRETPMGPVEMQLVRDTWGLGLSTVRNEGIPGVGMLLFTSTTPVELDLSVMRWSLSVTRNIADEYGEDFLEGIVNGVKQDFPIWTHKIHRANPVFCETDRYIAEYRRWSRQFYTEPVAAGTA